MQNIQMSLLWPNQIRMLCKLRLSPNNIRNVFLSAYILSDIISRQVVQYAYVQAQQGSRRSVRKPGRVEAFKLMSANIYVCGHGKWFTKSSILNLFWDTRSTTNLLTRSANALRSLSLSLQHSLSIQNLVAHKINKSLSQCSTASQPARAIRICCSVVSYYTEPTLERNMQIVITAASYIEEQHSEDISKGPLS